VVRQPGSDLRIPLKDLLVTPRVPLLCRRLARRLQRERLGTRSERGAAVHQRSRGTQRQAGLVRRNGQVDDQHQGDRAERLGNPTIDTGLLGQNLSFVTPGQASAIGGVLGASIQYNPMSNVSLFISAEGTAMSEEL